MRETRIWGTIFNVTTLGSYFCLTTTFRDRVVDVEVLDATFSLHALFGN